jgi:bisphosphoglycerate-independent phosphoglycerate mutase (AlkP superfamily)
MDWIEKNPHLKRIYELERLGRGKSPDNTPRDGGQARDGGDKREMGAQELAAVLKMEEGPEVEEALYRFATRRSSPDTRVTAANWAELLQSFYSAGVDDQFIPPLVLKDARGRPQGLIEDGDILVYFDFRTDRAKPLTASFVGVPYEGQVGGLSDQAAKPPRVHFVTMTHYDDRFVAEEVPSEQRPQVAFMPPPLTDTYAEVAGRAGIRQLVVGETEKWRAVTWFKDGRRNL